MKRSVLVGVFVAVLLAVPAAVYASNSNPLCYLVERYSIEWYVLFCNLTETPDPQG